MRPLARAVAASAAALTAIGTLTAAPAVAAEPLTATITSHTPDSTITGTVPVTVHVTAQPGVTAQTATATITSTEEPGRVRTGIAPVPAGCVPECDVTVPVDTLTFTDPGLRLTAPDISLLDHWNWNYNYNNWAFVTATVAGTTDTGATVHASADPIQVTVDNPRPWLSAGAGAWDPIVGAAPIDLVAWIVPQDGSHADRLEVALFGNGIERRYTFPAPPVDAEGKSVIETTLPSTGLATGNYTLRFVAFDSEGRASYITTDGFAYYTGPTVTVNRLLPTMSGGKQGALIEATVTVGPRARNLPYRPRTVAVVLDGDPATRTVIDVPWDIYCEDCPMSVPVRIPVALPAKGAVPGELTPGAHTVSATYTEQVGYFRGHYFPTATVTTTKQVSAPGIAAALTVKGPVVQSATGSLAFTLTSRAGTGAAAPQLRSWRLTGPSSTVLGSGTCTGTSCLSVTGSVSLKSLRGWYPTLEPRTNRNVPLTLTYTDSAGITRTARVTVPVDPAVKVNLTAPATGTAGGTGYLTIGVQQLTGGYSLPGVPVTLQTRTAGSSTWRTVATSKTTSTGTVRVPAALKYNTYWRVLVPARAGWNGAGTSAQRYTKVAAKVTASGPSIVTIGRYYTVKAALNPVSSGRRVTVQMREGSTSTWKTVARPATNKYGQVSARVKFGPGTWHLRVVADATTTSASGTWSKWISTR